jgi:hypothetical protein
MGQQHQNLSTRVVAVPIAYSISSLGVGGDACFYTSGARLLQLGILSLGFFKDGNVGVGIFP